MIIFYPPAKPLSIPVVIADMTDSSDQWSTAEIMAQVLANIPAGVTITPTPSVFSCKYSYEIHHDGVPLGQSLKMHLSVLVKMPPAELIAQTSINYFATAETPEALSNAIILAANPQLNVMHAVAVEKTAGIAPMARAFVAYSSKLQPDSLGTGATLSVNGAAYSDAIIQTGVGFQLNTLLPLGAQLSAMGAAAGFVIVFDPSAAAASAAPPRSGKLFPPSTIARVIDEICLQNMLVPFIDGTTITIYSQTTAPIIGALSIDKNEFSFLGYAGSVLWAVGIENYANIKFKTAVFDAKLFSTIIIYDDVTDAKDVLNAGLFSGMKRSLTVKGGQHAAYEMTIMRYIISRNDRELTCEVTATNNWLFSQIRVDGILESKIFSSVSI